MGRSGLLVHSPFRSREDLERAKATEFEARAYLQEQLDVQYSQQCHLSAEAEWKYATNITKENEKLKVIPQILVSALPR